METEKWLKAIDAYIEPTSIQDREFNLIGVNQALADLLQVRREDLVGKKCYHVMHGSDCPIADCPHSRTLETGISVTKKLFEPRLGVNLEASTLPILDRNQKVIASIHVLKDIYHPKLEHGIQSTNEIRVNHGSGLIGSNADDAQEQPLDKIINIEALHSLIDNLYNVNPIPFALIDLKGQVLVGIGWQEICTQFHRVNPQTLCNCLESDTILSQGLKQGEIREYKCKNNLWDIVTPLFVGNRHIGNIFSGQFFYEDETVDYDFFATQAERYGFDKAAYLSAVQKIPRWDRAKIQSLMLFYSQLAEMIASLSNSNLDLKSAITEQNKIASSLKESQLDLKHAQEVSHTGNWRLDLLHNTLLWSEETYRIFGIPIGTPMNFELFLAKIHPEDQQYVNQKWSEALKGKGYDIEHRILIDGNIKWVHEKGLLEFDQQGNLQSGFGTVQDITVRKQAEESLKHYTTELENANLELEAFSYSASHDLRQPLRTLDGFSQVILEDYADKLDDQGKDYLNRVRAASQHMACIIDDMINLSKISQTEINCENINLSELVLSISDNLKNSQPARNVEFVIAKDISTVGDSGLIALALKNLLENSFKFTSKKSQARIEFGVVQDAENELYFIKDNGIGFDMRYSGKLFKPFQRLHQNEDYPGDGIGLATVERIIRRHQGQIWADSKPDEGTIIYFTLSENQKNERE